MSAPTIYQVQGWLDYLAGVHRDPPDLPEFALPGWTWGAWWTVLSVVIYCFCGASIRFIYIDF